MSKTEFFLCRRCKSYILIKERLDGRGENVIVVKEASNGKPKIIAPSKKAGIFFKKVPRGLCLSCGSGNITQLPNHKIGKTIGPLLKRRT